MGNYKITLLVAPSDGQEQLEATKNSVQSQNHGMGAQTQVIPLAADEDKSIWERFGEAAAKAEAPYCMMIHAGDTFSADALWLAAEYFDKTAQQTDVLMMNCRYQGKVSDFDIAGQSDNAGTKTFLCALDTLDDLVRLPFFWEALVFKTKTLQHERFDERHAYETLEEYVYRILDKKRTIGCVGEAEFFCSRPSRKSARGNAYMQKSGFYLEGLKDHAELTIACYKDKYGEVPLFVQCHLLYTVYVRIVVNKGQSDQHVLEPGQIDAFYEIARGILREVTDELMIAGVKIARMGEWSYPWQQMFLKIKYGEALKENYYIGSKKDGCPLKISVQGREMPPNLSPKVKIHLINYENGKLVLECSSAYFLRDSDIRWNVLLNGKTVPCEETSWYSSLKYFGREECESHTFRVVLAAADFAEKNELVFTLNQDKRRTPYPITALRYTARLSNKVKGSYWCFGDYLMYFNRGRKKTRICIERSSLWKHFLRESMVFAGLMTGKSKKPEMVPVRLQYWLSWTKYHNKNIWITFDKIFKGGDCGEYFYKYAAGRKDSDVVMGYLINEDAPDKERLEKEGYQPLVYGSKKHREMFLHAKMVFATHAGIYNFNAVSEEEIPYLQDLLHADAVCIQHGLTVQDLAFNANRIFNNNKLYYCASKYEVQNLMQPKYGYEGTDAVRLTGIPRFDGLVNDDRKQILITPTWRSYITLPPVGKNNARPYSEDFKNTDYFHIYNELISDKRLVETAKKTGYKLIYLLHPHISVQISDYSVHEGVEIVSALDINYEKILTQSSLMVTDYSGVQFDFAYMRKPVVYYHTPKLPYHYLEGGFFYDTQGFGEICTEHDELVETLCAYMESGCALKPFYKERQDDFFAFDDHESCRRIFEDAYAYQKAKNGKKQ